MEQTIQEAQLEKMRLKAKKLEKVVIVLSVVMLLAYIAVSYTHLIHYMLRGVPI